MKIQTKLNLVPALVTLLALGSAVAAHADFDRTRKKTFSNCSTHHKWTLTFMGFRDDWNARAGLRRQSAEPVPMVPAGFASLPVPGPEDAPPVCFEIGPRESVTLMIDPPPGRPRGVGVFLLQGPAPWRVVPFAFKFDADEDATGPLNSLFMLEKYRRPGTAEYIHCGLTEIFLLDPAGEVQEGAAPGVEREKEAGKAPAPAPALAAEPEKEAEKAPAPAPAAYGSFLEPKRISVLGLGQGLP